MTYFFSRSRLIVTAASSRRTGAGRPRHWILKNALAKLIFATIPVFAHANTIDDTHLSFIEPAVAEAIAAKEIPGCVVLVVHGGETRYLRAFGNRSLEPEVVPMTTDTLFDMASITKPVATATSVMILVERGKLRLQDPVARYLPDFAQNGKAEITVHQCLTHQAGFVPDSPLSEYTDPEQIRPKLMALGTIYPPGSKFVYSDVGFQVLGYLVAAVSGQPLNEFAAGNIFTPLEMRDTGYLPSEALRERAAPTEQRDEQWMIGEVHDPRAYAMGGVAGHAGLFSTAEDLARYARMMLNGGELHGKRILSPAMVDAMTAAYPSGDHQRGLGWDKRSKYSENRGETMTDAAFGHGGFTGTAMWVDPGLDIAVVVLSNRVHPDGTGTVNRLAGRIATIATAAVAERGVATSDHEASVAPQVTPQRSRLNEASSVEVHPDPDPRDGRPILTGIDVLQRDGFAQLDGLRIGLITNHTGHNRDGQPTLELLNAAASLQLTCLFSPEHGLAGVRDDNKISDAVDGTTGLPIYSLYGERRAPNREHLEGLDAVVFDIQDIGTRFYTYVSTMGGAMEIASQQGLRFIVLDRPNPIGGEVTSGPVLDPGRECFVGFHPIAVRHGMTVGELARMIVAERKWDLQLEVIPVEGWQRSMTFDELQLIWTNPSPNMRRFQQALLYPGVGLLETSNISVGRGTDTPFEVVGAPWIDGRVLAERLNGHVTGVRCVPIRFTPESSKHKDQRCGGIRFSIVDQKRVEPVKLGLQLACALRDLFGDQWDMQIDRLLLDKATLAALKHGKDVDQIRSVYADELQEFKVRRSRFLIY